MSIEEAEYFHGVLNKKQHWSTIQRLKREEQKGVTSLFKIEKVDRGSKEEVEDPQDAKSCFDRWKEETRSPIEDDSFHMSLGHSVKLKS
mmetsp:Transcript_7394/g.11579  ORF Transcript_7394/g.11579 Transcript_7394/m.11579 type:complete len:89 (+) Transcript_7394:536-802(+)